MFRKAWVITHVELVITTLETEQVQRPTKHERPPELKASVKRYEFTNSMLHTEENGTEATIELVDA